MKCPKCGFDGMDESCIRPINAVWEHLVVCQKCGYKCRFDFASKFWTVMPYQKPINEQVIRRR